MPAISTGLAVGLGVAASAGGSIVSGVLAKKGAEKQATAAERSSAQAIAEQRRQFDITQKNMQPWLTAGTQSIQMLQYLLGLGVPPGQATQVTSQVTGVPEQQLNERLQQLQQIGGFRDNGRPFMLDGGGRENAFDPSTIPTRGVASGTSGPPSGGPSGAGAGGFGSLSRDFSAEDFQADPGYAFRLEEGFKALERSAAARGTVLSGGTLKELARYNQGFASNEFGNAYNRFQENRRTRFNQLAAISGVGQQTGAQLGDLGARNATNIGNLTIAGATSAAALRASGYNAFGNAIGNAANVPLNWLALSRMNAGPSSGPGSAADMANSANWYLPGR